MLAAPRGISLLAASFIGCLYQGIRHVPYVAYAPSRQQIWLGPRERDNVITRLSRLCCFQGSSAGDRSADGDEPRLRSAPTQSRQQYSVSVVDDSRLSSSDSRRIIRRRSLYHSARACQPPFPEGRSLPCRRELGGAPESGGRRHFPALAPPGITATEQRITATKQGITATRLSFSARVACQRQTHSFHTVGVVLKPTPMGDAWRLRGGTMNDRRREDEASPAVIAIPGTGRSPKNV